MDNIKSGQAYVVLGFQRGGTSLLSRLVQGAGVSFGDLKGQKKVDQRNPYGFFEYKRILKLEDRLLKQAGYQIPRDFSLVRSFNAKGAYYRVMRFFDRLKMVRHLSWLAQGNDKWGLKIFVQNMFFWKQYLVEPKVIAIYRHPIANAHSLVKAFNKNSFYQAVEYWRQNMQEMIYYLSQYDSILICYEDLLDPTRQEEVLQKLVDFLGQGEIDSLKTLIDAKIGNREKNDWLLANYPLNSRTKEVLKTLNRIKI